MSEQDSDKLYYTLKKLEELTELVVGLQRDMSKIGEALARHLVMTETAANSIERLHIRQEEFSRAYAPLRDLESSIEDFDRFSEVVQKFMSNASSFEKNMEVALTSIRSELTHEIASRSAITASEAGHKSFVTSAWVSFVVSGLASTIGALATYLLMHGK